MANHPVAGQLLVTITIIVAVTVFDMRSQSLLAFVPINISNIFSVANHGEQNAKKEITVKKYKELQAIYSNSRWWNMFSLDQFIYNQQQHKQLDVVVVQCNQHHREIHHQVSTRFKILYKTIAIEGNQLINVVDFNFINNCNTPIVQIKKILVESIIFAYLISLDLYS